MKKLLFGALLGFAAVSTPADAQWCPSLLSGWWGLQSSVLDDASYTAKRTAWQELFSQFPVPAAAAVRDRLAQDNSLLNWLALHDGMTAEHQASLFQAAKSLEHQNVALIEKRMLWSATAEGALRIRRLPFWGLKQIRFYLPRRIPRLSDDWPQWLLDTLTELNTAITQGSFLASPSQFADHLKRADALAYEVAFQLERALETRLKFYHDKVENHWRITEASLYALRFTFPTSGRIRWVPQDSRFRRYAAARGEGRSAPIAAEEQGDDTVEGYRSRRRLEIFSRYYRSALLAVSLAGTAVGSVHIYDSIRNGTWRAKLDAVLAVEAVVADPQQRDQAIREYAEDPNGYDAVVDYYTEQIEALEKQRRENGDPDGALAKEIEFKRAQMEELKH